MEAGGYYSRLGLRSALATWHLGVPFDGAPSVTLALVLREAQALGGDLGGFSCYHARGVGGTQHIATLETCEQLWYAACKVDTAAKHKQQTRA